MYTLKPLTNLVIWRTVHADLIGPCTTTAKQIQPGGETKEVAMTKADPSTGWFEIIEVPYYTIKDVKNNEDDYIDKSSVRTSKLFKHMWLSSYTQSQEVIFGNRF